MCIVQSRHAMVEERIAPGYECTPYTEQKVEGKKETLLVAS